MRIKKKWGHEYANRFNGAGNETRATATVAGTVSGVAI
jgi:hypothetical protein